MSNRQSIEPSLNALSFALRHKELWPDGFRWDFMSCETCALGLARRMWPKVIHRASSHDIIAAFKITGAQALHCFGSSPGYNTDVTPEMVADRIDALVC